MPGRGNGSPPCNTSSNLESTQVVIVGAGPAGLLLGQLLHREGIDTWCSSAAARNTWPAASAPACSNPGRWRCSIAPASRSRLHAEGLIHDGVEIGFRGRRHRIALKELTGKSVTVYGQTEVTRDLMEARAAAGAPMRLRSGGGGAA